MQFDQNNKAIYLQIADRISDGIMRGTFAEESRLPSVRDYAADAEVNANTVMRAYERLASDGLIYNKRGIGFFVAPDARVKIIRARGADLIDNKLDALFSLMMHLGVTPDDLRREYAFYLEKHKNEEKQ